MKDLQLEKKISEFIISDNQQEAIRIMLDHYQNDEDKYEELVVIGANLQRAKREMDMGLLSNEEYSRTISRINKALLDFDEEKPLPLKKKKETEPTAPKNNNKKYFMAGGGIALAGLLFFFILKPGNSSSKIGGINVPTYIICESAFPTKQECQQRLVELGHKGYQHKSGFLWVPDFDCLSGQKLFQVYIGPFRDKEIAEKEICELNEKMGKRYYGVKLWASNSRVEFRCEE